ncbi:hypothetical protein JX265_008460 [Neoarthrinium moseri]|uniref:Uncharacterized protein n=1 Tax=Neoarthrinium moseri TaxID=1658444 RepID=A0A9Q0AMM9_9PEZI|nr:hypothetical protein JX265_008460 [Neoarthrinium moseri]
MPTCEEPTSSFDDLRAQHERFIDELDPSSEEEAEANSTMSSSAGPTFRFANMPTPSSTTSSGSRPIANLAIKPQFNLDSAQKLLETFKLMLHSCPCIVLDDDADVRSMARDSPFILLAILAATSCSTSLQGYSLYDEEFRKVLGLKFVTGGERSLELLQGIVVYCAWYPSHLRPKHRQAGQYLKMAIDIVQDLELGQEETFAHRVESGLTPDDFASIRAFLVSYYLVTVFTNAFSKTEGFPFTAWMGKCCDLLEQQSNIEQDHILSYRKSGSQSPHHRNLIRIGLETQLREWQGRIPTTLALAPSVMMSSLFDDMHISASPLISATRPRPTDTDTPLDPNRLLDTVHTLRAFFEFVASLSPDQMGRFSSADWFRLIMGVILAYRLSLPVDICPGFDASQARQIFNFGAYLERLCEEPEGGATGKTDCCTAFRVVLRSMKAKFEKRLAAAIAKEELTRKARECPMFDGSLDDYINLWDGHGAPLDLSYATSLSETSGVRTESLVEPAPAPEQAKQMEVQDLWGTMTLSWGAEDLPAFDMDSTGLGYDHL